MAEHDGLGRFSSRSAFSPRTHNIKDMTVTNAVRTTNSPSFLLPCLVFAYLPAGCDGSGDGNESSSSPSEERALQRDEDTVGDTAESGFLSDEGLNCYEIFKCLECCPTNDRACLMACYNAGSTTGQNAFSEARECMLESCTDECAEVQASCDQCLSFACGSEINACILIPNGTDNCKELDACLGPCPATPAPGSGSAETCPVDLGILCLSDCVTNASTDALDGYVAALDCMVYRCREDCTGEAATDETCDGCIEQLCGDLVTACVGE